MCRAAIFQSKKGLFLYPDAVRHVQHGLNIIVIQKQHGQSPQLMLPVRKTAAAV
jgi:hypothetical protein